MFQTQPLPLVAPTFRDDATFANLRVAGANPMMIQRVRALPAKLPLTNAQYRQVMGPGDSLADAIAGARLYLADYVDLGGLAPSGPIAKEQSGVGYAYKPMALFAVPKGGGSLVPVAIQCDQDPARFPIFFPAAPGEPGYWAWQMAKTIVQQADFNHHEMYTHLGRTHLFTEAFALATHRQLATTHPLYALLLPHFEGTFAINDRAATEICAPKMFAEILIAPQLTDTVTAVAIDRLNFDFYENMFPNDLRARGVDDARALPDYPFRDDGLLLWQAIADWVTEYVGLYYRSDRDVTNDTELAAWADDIAKNGQVKGFIRITSLTQLVQVVTAVIFNASVQHAAVNFPQKTLMTYVPSTSGTLAAQAPAGIQGQSEATWKRMLPPPLVTVAQVLFLSVLGSVYYKPLGQYRSATSPVGSAFTDSRVTAPLQRFQAKLQTIESTVQARNQSRATPYTTLLPSLIPASTNI
jgi:arachidonate 15-lipoxygenase